MLRPFFCLILLAVPVRAQAKALALEGATVHTMVLGQEATQQDVLIIDGRIRAVGTDLTYPERTERLNAEGLHIVPALIDGQVHFDPQHDMIYAANGIGLIRDAGGEHVWLLGARDNPERFKSVAPVMITSGKLIDIDSELTSAAALVASTDEVIHTISILHDAGVDFINISHRLPTELRAEVIEQAHARGLMVWSALDKDKLQESGEPLTLEQALGEGLDGILELNSVRPGSAPWDVVLPPAFLRPAKLLAESKTPVIPMFLANQVVLEDQLKNPSTDRFLGLMSPIYESRWLADLQLRLAQFGKNREMYESGKRILEKQQKLLKQLHDKGVRLVPGSGSPSPWLFPGIALHQELAFWVGAGISHQDVLAAATRVAAAAFGVEQDFGTIQAGRYASLIVTTEDPTENIVALRTPKWILSRGTLMEEADIDALYDGVLARENRARELLAKRIEIPQPILPEEASLLLEGRTDTHAMGLPLSSEHFRVGRLPDGALVFSSNIGFPKRDAKAERRTEVYQVVREGALDEVRVAVHLTGLPPLVMEGKWVAGSWRMQRTQDGKPAAPLVSDSRHPQILEVGSITTLMVLGQIDADPEKGIQVVTFLENLEPAMITWRMAIDDQGNHLLQTHQGLTAFHFDEKGAVLQARRRIGNEVVDFQLETSDAFGGPGLPLPAAKQQRIDALLEKARAAYAARLEAKAAAEAAAQVPEGTTPAPEPAPLPTADDGPAPPAPAESVDD